ncbi:hypothetical protein VTJ04DRAFT_1528 [Mycothermus thermophilus]|uniref:uncharacterized protein n=1 Tax=Humicola insolens TaxID=85995 RepID=UPI0037440979
MDRLCRRYISPTWTCKDEPKALDPLNVHRPTSKFLPCRNVPMASLFLTIVINVENPFPKTPSHRLLLRGRDTPETCAVTTTE